MSEEVRLGDILGPLSFEARVMTLEDDQRRELLDMIEAVPGIKRVTLVSIGDRNSPGSAKPARDHLKVFVDVGYESSNVRSLMERVKIIIDAYQRQHLQQRRG